MVHLLSGVARNLQFKNAVSYKIMEQLEFANAHVSYMSVPHIHSWGKISINFDIWEKSHDKYDQHHGCKAG